LISQVSFFNSAFNSQIHQFVANYWKEDPYELDFEIKPQTTFDFGL